MEKYLEYIPTLKNCFVNDNEFMVEISCDQGKFLLNIEYNTEADFEYFTMESSTHDGTLLFVVEVIQKIVDKVLRLGTYPTNNTPKDIVENLCNYNYKYIVGDIIVHRDFGMKNINGHNWQGETDIVVLPIKFEYVLK
jgi:hypothetical protein